MTQKKSEAIREMNIDVVAGNRVAIEHGTELQLTIPRTVGRNLIHSTWRIDGVTERRDATGRTWLI